MTAVDIRKRILVAVGLGACAIACLAPGLFLALVGGASAAALGAPVAIVLAALAAIVGFLLLRRRPEHECGGGACDCR